MTSSIMRPSVTEGDGLGRDAVPDTPLFSPFVSSKLFEVREQRCRRTTERYWRFAGSLRPSDRASACTFPVLIDQRLLFRPRPALDLNLPFQRVDPSREFARPFECDRQTLRRVLARRPRFVLCDPLRQVVCVADVQGPASASHDVDVERLQRIPV
jgi:hypothetical protein